MWGTVDVTGGAANAVRIDYPYTLASIPTVQLTACSGSYDMVPAVRPKSGGTSYITTTYATIQNNRSSTTTKNTIFYYIRGKVA